LHLNHDGCARAIVTKTKIVADWKTLEKSFAEILIAAQGARSIRDGQGGRAARERTMKARKDMHEELDVHAELYHRTRIEALRAEGERLRHELRRRGVDPTLILLEAQQARHMGEHN
jgi:uncharacterized protein YjaG (DUF416 family)